MTEVSLVRYEDVNDMTTEEYFNGNQFSIDAFNKKYALYEGETYIQALKRVCDFIASCEDTDEKRKYWSERWFDEVFNQWWHPAGSIMQGANSGKSISLSNCCTISLGADDFENEWDNLEGIIKNTGYEVAKCAAFRQGLGVDFSRIRPRKMKVLNSANESTGAIHWMKFIDGLGEFVGQFGRKPAMLMSISCTHPDVIEFIGIKKDYTVIQNANISVQCTDEFYSAISDDLDWKLYFDIPALKKGQKVYVDQHSTDMDCRFDDKKKKWYYLARRNRPSEHIEKIVKARGLMELIAKNMHANAEPGIQNIDMMHKYSNSDYVYDPSHPYNSKIISSNACSEQALSKSGLCVLSSINCGTFSTKPEEYEKQLEKIGSSINRFLDNVNEMELREKTYSVPYQRLGIEACRRTGAGWTNLTGWLFKQNLEYGSKEANDAAGKLQERYNYYMYKNSIEVGKEKGSFGLFNREKLEKSPFIQRMMKLGLEFEAMRNVTCSSIAPTGSNSLMYRNSVMSYGIEPSFGLYYWKRTRISGKYEYYFIVPGVVRDRMKELGYDLKLKSDTIKDTWDGKHGRPVAKMIDEAAHKLGLKCKSANEVSALDKLDLMSKVMEYCDSSISVTYMLPETSTWQDVYDFIILAHKRGVKSIAAFPDKKMYGIVSQMPFKDLAVKLSKEGLQIHNQNFSGDEADELAKLTHTAVECSGQITKTLAPERPKSLNCDVHHIKFTKKVNNKPETFNYLVVVGLLNGEPYEIFAKKNGSLDKSYIKGVLTKESKGRYSLLFADNTKIEDITETTEESDDLVTRLLSSSLRHGADIRFIVEQLEKTACESDLKFWSFSSALARALKKYIKNGEIAHKGGCSLCGGDLVYLEGCRTCSKCGNSKCS